MDDSLEIFPMIPLTNGHQDEKDSFFKLKESSVFKSEYVLRSRDITLSVTNEPSYKIDVDPEIYNLTHHNRGKAIIINNRDFYDNTGLNTRMGTDQDADAVRCCFSNLGFDAFICQNLTVKHITHLAQSISLEDFTHSDCLVWVIMTHGEDGHLWGTDATFKLEHLVSYFKGDVCPSLAGKPKLFFIQACRGTKLDEGVTYEYTDADFDEVDARVIRKIPVEADFLLAYSVVNGYYSWRNCQDGSWFIQSLCKALHQHAKSLDLLRILTRVNHLVCNNYESNTNDPDWHRKKQCPSIVSMLTKDLYFYHPSFAPIPMDQHDGLASQTQKNHTDLELNYIDNSSVKPIECNEMHHDDVIPTQAVCNINVCDKEVKIHNHGDN